MPPRRCPAGRLPLWQSSDGFGQPLLGQGKLAVFSPTVLPLLRARWLHLRKWPYRAGSDAAGLAGIGAASVARKIGRNGMMLAAVGVLYLIAGAVLGQVSDTLAEAWCWLGWCVLALLWLADRVTPARLAIAALPFVVVFSLGDMAGACAVIVTGIGTNRLGLAAGWVVPVVCDTDRHRTRLAMAGGVWWTWWDARHVTAVSLSFKPPGQIWLAEKINLGQGPCRRPPARRRGGV